MCRVYLGILYTVILFEYANNLDVVSGKSGEEQVKEALERAQKESEEAARKDKQESLNEREQLELKQFLKARQDGTANHVLLSSNLAAVLGRKVDELRKYSNNRYPNNNNQALEPKRLSNEDQRFAAMKEDADAQLERDSDRKMVEMARKLNNLVQKFQRKIGRLSERNHAATYLNLHPKLASFMHSKRPIPPVRYAELLAHLKGHSLTPQRYAEENSQVKTLRGNTKKPLPKDSGGIDLMALKKALGLLHKGNSKANEVVGSKTSYKEDTKLEDRLAMEAEEEKKFSNSDSYEYGGMGGNGGGGGGGGGSKGSSASQATFSPKEQASKEMQSYNDLISSESNRELSQIQDEITKATQSSMGQVSVVGQKEHVQTENPEPPLGGIGSLDGIGNFNQDSGGLMGGNMFGNGPSMKGAIDSSSIGPPGSSESFPGSAAANEALENALQASANADMNGESMNQQQQQPQQPEAQVTNEGQPNGQEQAQEMANSQLEMGGGYQDQKQGEMNAINIGGNFEGGQGGGQMEEGNQMMQQMNSNNYMQEGGMQGGMQSQR